MKKSALARKRSLIGLIILLAVFSVLPGCSKSSMSDTGSTNPNDNPGNTAPGANEVWMKDKEFVPSSITVTSGTTVTWINKDPIMHDVTSDSDLFGSGSMQANATFSFKFTTAGTYTYHCTIHPTMTGKVIVN
jgi:plastocyanin